MTDGVKHVDAAEQADFETKTVSEKLLLIWLNGRETNGAVAEVKRDIAVMRPKVERHDFAFKVAAVAFGLIIAAGPFIVWGLGLIGG